MKCKKCKKECERRSSGLPGGWEYWYCTNWSCELGSPNNVPQHAGERNLNTLERRLDASARVTPVEPLKKRVQKTNSFTDMKKRKASQSKGGKAAHSR